MMSSSPMARLVSVANATRLFRAISKQTFASTSANNAKSFGFFTHSNNEAIASRYNTGHFAHQPQQPLSSFFSTSSSGARYNIKPSSSTLFTRATTATSSPFFQGQAIRGFSRRAWKAEHESFSQAAHDCWYGHRAAHGGFRGFHHHHHYMMRRRRPMRFIFRMMVLSTVLVAIPAIMVFDAPCSTLAKVPLTVFGVGVVLMLAGRLVYIALPVLAIGGATMFWVTTMPAANTVKDLKKILEREERAGRYTTALSILGSDWEIQRAQPNEWFRWTFPERGDKKQLDKIDIRIAIFDSNDYNDHRESALKLLDKFEDMNMNEMKRRCKHRQDKHDIDCSLMESLKLKRDGDQVVIQMEEDGEKLMEQKFAKKYLNLGRIVDKAAKEMEAARPGLNLGEQVVLVRKNRGYNRDSFWSRWSPYGDLSLRIPFNRTWVNDLSDE
ncbi:hypothetical protein BGZ65_012463 [Modicella reniformis]|uniref:Uncharacterized protein n=1 Tax=Modicella reniformis TaxID=1440133 RepID=A0A9P6MBK0_9FUNG|nr:hypothetical protein BGZ65_012463 [Modicella reniformis]